MRFRISAIEGSVYNVLIINMPSRWDSFNLLKVNTYIIVWNISSLCDFTDRPDIVLMDN